MNLAGSSKNVPVKILQSSSGEEWGVNGRSQIKSVFLGVLMITSKLNCLLPKVVAAKSTLF